MKNLAAAGAILALGIIGITVVPSFARPLSRQAKQAAVQQQKKGPAVSSADAIDGFYINRIKAGVNLTDDQVEKIAPFLLRMLRERREITVRRNQAMTQLRQATNQGAVQPKRDLSDEELAKVTRDLDQTEADRLASQQAFLKNVDPLLNDRQRARLRVFQDNIERQILAILNNINNSANPPVPANPPAEKAPPLH